MLRDITEDGRFQDVTRLPHRRDFEAWYQRVPENERIEMERHINGVLDECAANPNRFWGSILNTSIEGGKESPETGVRGDWSGTPHAPLWHACGQSDQQAALVFGNLWKLMIIQRTEPWIGIRNTADRPTFPNRGIVLPGKTYFVANDS